MKLNRLIIMLLVLMAVSACKRNSGSKDDSSTDQQPTITKHQKGINVTTFAGSVTSGKGDTDTTSKLTDANFYGPTAITLKSGSSLDLLILDTVNKKLKELKASPSAVSVSAVFQTDNANSSEPGGIAVVAAGNYYVSDIIKNVIYKYSNGAKTIFAGTDGVPGYVDNASPLTAKFNRPFAIVFDAANKCLYVADSANNIIRKIDLNANGAVTTFAGLYYTNTSLTANPNNTVATQATFTGPLGLLLLKNGNLLIADSGNNAIRMLAISNGTAGAVTSVIGLKYVASPPSGGYSYSRDIGFVNGPVADAKINNPYGLTTSSGNNIYFTDSGNNVIRKINATYSGNAYTFTNVETVAGDGAIGLMDSSSSETTNDISYDASFAKFNTPKGIVFYDKALYVADYNNNNIRKIEFFDATP